MMDKQAKMGPALLTLGLGGGALAGALALDDIVDDIGDVIKQKYITQAAPVWETSGQSRLMSDYGNLYRSTRAKEMMYNMLFNTPEEAAKATGKGLGTTLSDFTTAKYQPLSTADAIVRSLSKSPEIQAIGSKRARDLVGEVLALAPQATSAAPSAILPILQTAIDSGSMSLRPEMVNTLVESEHNYRRRGKK